VRATRPVSHPPPIYYAHLLCERARSYFTGYYNPDDARWKNFKQEIIVAEDVTKDEVEVMKRNTAWEERYNEGNNRHGPWNAKLNDTMFWM
jgi:hypothetical protein